MSAQSANSSKINLDSALMKIINHFHLLTGNQVNEKHHSMIIARLQKRALELNLQSINEYCDYFWKNEKTESNTLISLLTTHHSFFFREFVHFEFLANHSLPALIEKVRKRPNKKLRIWSAACSKGQEVYSLAMFLEHYIKTNNLDISYQIYGSDIDPASVAFAKNGIYELTELNKVPMVYLANSIAYGKDKYKNYGMILEKLQKNTFWESINLLSIPNSFKEQFDIIFCRNVFIYFNKDQIKKITSSFLNHLNPDGFLFVGVSESLAGIDLPLKAVGPSVFIRQDSEAKAQRHSLKTEVATNPTHGTHITTTSLRTLSSLSPVVEKPLKVLCVDDSSTIHSLMKKIFSEDKGFQIVGTAFNGIEAEEQIKKLNPDIVTLDIHMPEMGGLEYLKKNYNKSHPPVVVVSSVSREDHDSVMQCLSLGASDFIEKPNFSNLDKISDELKMKLRAAFNNWNPKIDQKPLQMPKPTFEEIRTIKPSEQIRIILCQLSDKARIEKMIIESPQPYSPTIILVDGSKEALPHWANATSIKTIPIVFTEKIEKLDQFNQIYLTEAKQFGSLVKSNFSKRKASILVFGECHPSNLIWLSGWLNAQILFEDLGASIMSRYPIGKIASDIVPATSFAYMSHNFLWKK